MVLNLDFIDQHEPSGEIIKYVDKNLRDFLELTKKEMGLDESVIMLHSDHGLHMRGIYQ